MDEKVLEDFYQEKLEERLIDYISEMYDIDYQKAMNIYYNSELANKIHEGRYGIQYLDHKVLAEILVDTEPDLFNE